jgi:hypothetical protein
MRERALRDSPFDLGRVAPEAPERGSLRPASTLRSMSDLDPAAIRGSQLAESLSPGICKAAGNVPLWGSRP